MLDIYILYLFIEMFSLFIFAFDPLEYPKYNWVSLFHIHWTPTPTDSTDSPPPLLLSRHFEDDNTYLLISRRWSTTIVLYLNML